MARWFRRKGKDTGQDEENGTTPLVEETEPGPEAASGPEVTGEEALAESEPEAPEAAPAQTETDSGPQRRGFLRRWLLESPPEDAAPPPLEESAVESEAVGVEAPPPPPPELPPPPRSWKPRRPYPAPPPKTSRLRSLRNPRRQRHTPEILAAEDLEETGEVPVEAERRGMFRRLRERLGRTREALSGGMDRLFRGPQGC